MILQEPLLKVILNLKNIFELIERKINKKIS